MSKKKKTITFDLDKKKDKLAYEVLKNKGRESSDFVIELILNDEARRLKEILTALGTTNVDDIDMRHENGPAESTNKEETITARDKSSLVEGQEMQDNIVPQSTLDNIMMLTGTLRSE